MAQVPQGSVYVTPLPFTRTSVEICNTITGGKFSYAYDNFVSINTEESQQEKLVPCIAFPLRLVLSKNYLFGFMQDNLSFVHCPIKKLSPHASLVQSTALLIYNESYFESLSVSLSVRRRIPYSY